MRQQNEAPYNDYCRGFKEIEEDGAVEYLRCVCKACVGHGSLNDVSEVENTKLFEFNYFIKAQDILQEDMGHGSIRVF